MGDCQELENCCFRFFSRLRASSPRRLARARHPRPQPRRNGDAYGRDEDVHAHSKDGDIHAPSKDEDCNFGGRKITESEKALLREKKCIHAKIQYINQLTKILIHNFEMYEHV